MLAECALKTQVHGPKTARRMTAVRAHGHQRGATCRHPLRLGQNRDDTSDLAQKGSKTAGGLRPLKEKPGKTQMRPANRDIKAMKA